MSLVVKYFKKKEGKMFECLKDRGPKVHKPKPLSPIKNGEIEAVYFFIGHQSPLYGNHNGTDTYNDINEHESNEAMVFKFLLPKLQNKYGTFVPVHAGRLREEGSDEYSRFCRRSKEWLKKDIRTRGYNPQNVVVVELHYNAAGIPEARGGEAIVSNHKSAVFAYPLVIDWCESNGIKKRRSYSFTGQDGKHYSYRGVNFKGSGRGTGWTKAIQSLGCYTILWEPFFCDYRSEETKKFFDDHEAGLDKISDFWVRHIGEWLYGEDLA